MYMLKEDHPHAVREIWNVPSNMADTLMFLMFNVQVKIANIVKHDLTHGCFVRSRNCLN